MDVGDPRSIIPGCLAQMLIRRRGIIQRFEELLVSLRRNSDHEFIVGLDRFLSLGLQRCDDEVFQRPPLKVRGALKERPLLWGDVEL